jgi:hypothetical protein
MPKGVLVKPNSSFLKKIKRLVDISSVLRIIISCYAAAWTDRCALSIVTSSNVNSWEPQVVRSTSSSMHGISKSRDRDDPPENSNASNPSSHQIFPSALSDSVLSP